MMIKLFEQYTSEQQGINDAIKLAKQFASYFKLDIANSPELTGYNNPEYGFVDFGDPKGGSFMSQFQINGIENSEFDAWYLAVYPEEGMITLAADAMCVQIKGKNLYLIEDFGMECMYTMQEWKKIKPEVLKAWMADPEE